MFEYLVTNQNDGSKLDPRRWSNQTRGSKSIRLHSYTWQERKDLNFALYKNIFTNVNSNDGTDPLFVLKVLIQ